MFHARIVSPRGSLYFAAEATPYDLENLRTHVRDLQSPRAKDVLLEFSVDGAPDSLVDRQVSTLLQQLADEGIRVSLCPAAGSTPAMSRR